MAAAVAFEARGSAHLAHDQDQRLLEHAAGFEIEDERCEGAVEAGEQVIAEAVALIGRLTGLRDRYGLEVPSWRLGLAALARKLPPDEVYGWLQRLKVRRRDAEAIAAAVTVGPRLVERLQAGAEPAEVVALADPYAPDAPLFALALADLPPLHEYFERLRGVRLEVSGADLAELGLAESPRVGEVLAELRRRKLNGELDGRESELAAAKELI